LDQRDTVFLTVRPSQTLRVLCAPPSAPSALNPFSVFQFSILNFLLILVVAFSVLSVPSVVKGFRLSVRRHLQNPKTSHIVFPSMVLFRMPKGLALQRRSLLPVTCDSLRFTGQSCS
jgi:hypothetical protein